MCDYSLQGGPNRLAVEGEQLVTYRFPTGSVGLAALYLKAVFAPTIGALRPSSRRVPLLLLHISYGLF
jgi:hypothetical protein